MDSILLLSDFLLVCGEERLAAEFLVVGGVEEYFSVGVADS